MKHTIPFLVLALAGLVAGCSAATEAPITTVAGAYVGVSIDGSQYPVAAAPAADGTRQEIVAERLWLGGTAGANGALRRLVIRTTPPGGTAHIDSTTVSGTFYPTLATAQTSFGPVTASGSTIVLKATDGTTRVFKRDE